MKHWIVLTVIVLFGVGVLAKSERAKVNVPASPAAILYFVADTERELTRMPMQLTRMSDTEEIRIGNDLANNYQNQYSNNASSREIENYIQQVGGRVAAHAHRKPPYQFHYIPDAGFVNAFALPGGHVFIGEGLVALMDTEDELAAVLGHEVEHIDHYHCAERVQQEQILRKIPLGELVGLPIEVFEAGYTKDQELEADREGTGLAVEAGYSADGAIHMFQVFQQAYKEEQQSHAENPGEELSQVAWQALEGYFRSHPLPAERIEQLQRIGWPHRPEQTLAIKQKLTLQQKATP